jgi:hypothetical protein
MRCIKSAVLCIAAACTLAAVAASSAAAAAPEFTGVFPKKFTSTSKTTLLETPGKKRVACTADTNAGEFTAPSSGTAKIRFTGCQLVLPTGRIPCNSAGAAAEEIATFTLPARLGYIVHTPTLSEVGLDLGGPPGFAVMEFLCGNIRAFVTGSVIGKITPINKLLKPPAHFVVKFAQTKGAQKPPSLEGEPPDTLSATFGGPAEPTGMSSTDMVGFFEPVMLIA